MQEDSGRRLNGERCRNVGTQEEASGAAHVCRCLWCICCLSSVKGECISCMRAEKESRETLSPVCCFLIAFSSKLFLCQGGMFWGDRFWFPPVF